MPRRAAPRPSLLACLPSRRRAARPSRAATGCAARSRRSSSSRRRATSSYKRDAERPSSDRVDDEAHDRARDARARRPRRRVHARRTTTPAPIESQIGLRAGERMTVARPPARRCSCPAANDAAVTLAVGVSGSRNAFVRAMNPTRAAARAARHALREPDRARRRHGNYSTAADLAKLALVLRRNDVLRARRWTARARRCSTRLARAHGRSTATRSCAGVPAGQRREDGPHELAPATCSSDRRRATASPSSAPSGRAQRGARATPTR